MALTYFGTKCYIAHFKSRSEGVSQKNCVPSIQQTSTDLESQFKGTLKLFC